MHAAPHLRPDALGERRPGPDAQQITPVLHLDRRPAAGTRPRTGSHSAARHGHSAIAQHTAQHCTHRTISVHVSISPRTLSVPAAAGAMMPATALHWTLGLLCSRSPHMAHTAQSLLPPQPVSLSCHSGREHGGRGMRCATRSRPHGRGAPVMTHALPHWAKGAAADKRMHASPPCDTPAAPPPETADPTRRATTGT